MSALAFAQQLVETLPVRAPDLFNPWRDACPEDLPGNGPQEKLQRLAAHLDCDPRFILCGEAPGYQGCRHSGVAFTSERHLMDGVIPRIEPIRSRLTRRNPPYSEPSATIVWKALYQLGLAEDVVLWNALQMHPFRRNNTRSNRTPTPAEIALGRPALRLLVERFPKARVVAVGRKAADLLQDMGIAVEATVRHPANGGASLFTSGLADLVSAK